MPRQQQQQQQHHGRQKQSAERPPEKRNPRIMFVDLERAGERELRRGLEQVTRALVGRLNASESLHEGMRKAVEERRRRTGHSSPPPPPLPVSQQFAPLLADSAPPMPLSSAATTAYPGRMKKAAFIACGPQAASHSETQRELLRFLESVGHSPESRFLHDPTGGEVVAAASWLLSGLVPGQRILFHFVGASGRGELYARGGEGVSRSALADFLWMVPQGVQLTAVFDTGNGGTPLELPYSVVAHHHGGFEMTTGSNSAPQPGYVLLISTYQDLQEAVPALGIGCLTPVLLSLLRATLYPTFRHLVTAVREELSATLGPWAPVPLVSSSKPFHPEAIAELV